MAEQWRILIIEGEENLNWNMVNALQKDGYIVRGVTGGGEAIRLLWSEEYDVVICDQQMPDADGFDLLQWMRTYSPNARMVMLGAPGNITARSQALEMGVSSYLEKPLELHVLKAELRRMLHSTGFSASLDSFDLLDVVQIITMSRKSIALVVSTGLEEQGTLRFQNGELISAEYGILRVEEA
ncbi:MAG: response regulator, partial [Ktedonobacteraceae bacterium]